MTSKEQTLEVIANLDRVGADSAGVKKALNMVENLTKRSQAAKQHMSSLRPDDPKFDDQSHQAALTWSSLESQIVSATNDLDQAIREAKKAAVESDLVLPYKARLTALDDEILSELFRAANKLNDRFSLCQEFDVIMADLHSWANELHLDLPGSRPEIGGEEPIGNSRQEHLKKFMSRFIRAFSYAEPAPADKVKWFSRRHI
jgi:hypothetical protein